MDTPVSYTHLDVYKRQTLTSATNDQKKVTDKISGEVTIASAYKTMTDLQEEVAKLQAKSIGTEITSPISGTVTDIAVTAGTTVNANDVMMTIQPENKAYVLQFLSLIHIFL